TISKCGSAKGSLSGPHVDGLLRGGFQLEGGGWTHSSNITLSQSTPRITLCPSQTTATTTVLVGDGAADAPGRRGGGDAEVGGGEGSAFMGDAAKAGVPKRRDSSHPWLA
ncbi:hypothetical protein BaRGS_00020932, partial [Batillaria attramentaria]